VRLLLVVDGIKDRLGLADQACNLRATLRCRVPLVDTVAAKLNLLLSSGANLPTLASAMGSEATKGSLLYEPLDRVRTVDAWVDVSAMGGDMTPDVDLCRRCGIHGMVFRARLLSSLPET
jgi:hypothetical protein